MREAAKQAGITQGYLSQLENGLYVPSAKTISKLATAYGSSEQELLYFAGILKELMISQRGGELLPLIAAAERDAARVLERIVQHTRNGLRGLSDERMIGLFDCSGQQLSNLKGLPTGLRLPLDFCGYDSHAFMLEMDGEDLQPLICVGDWVLVSPSTVVYPDEVAVLYDGERFILRKYCDLGGMVGFHPSSTRFPSWNLDEAEEQKIDLVGRALRVVNRELRCQTRAMLMFQ